MTVGNVKKSRPRSEGGQSPTLWGLVLLSEAVTETKYLRGFRHRHDTKSQCLCGPEALFGVLQKKGFPSQPALILKDLGKPSGRFRGGFRHFRQRFGRLTKQAERGRL